MSILIVEDDKISAKILEVNLKKWNYQTIVAHNAKKALEYLSLAIEIELVITDIMMPEIDGLELLAKMKEASEWKNIPVIMFTSLADAETVKKSISMGCKHYLIKPINPKALQERVAEALENEKPILVNGAQIKEQFGLDTESYEEIVRVLYTRLRDKIPVLEQQIQNGTVTLLPSDLGELSEGASILGGKRVVDILDRLGTKSDGLESGALISEYRLLLRELKLLQKALPYKPLVVLKRPFSPTDKGAILHSACEKKR